MKTNYTPAQPDSMSFCFTCAVDRALGTCRVVVTAQLNDLNAKPLHKRVAIAIDEGQRDVTIDLTHCDAVQRIGYSMLLSLAQLARKGGGAVTILGAKGDVRELFEFYHIADQFTFATREGTP